ncbi:MAG: hypothetical protein WBE76_08110 [Terracidiphilus sp.]
MHSKTRGPILARAITCWNWKCALLSACARSLVYLAAMARGAHHGRLAIVMVEIAYVTLTAGIYAGLQQSALTVRPRLIGSMIVAVGVPGLAQAIDWLVHRAVGAAAPARATLAVCIFAGFSALFHLYVMRRGAFLTGERGHSLVKDFRRMPRLIADFVSSPVAAFPALAARVARALNAEAAA